MTTRNKIFGLLLALLACINVQTACAEEITLSFENITVAQGQTEVEIPVYLVNETTSICNLQLDVKLPEGMEIPFDEEEEAYTIEKGGRAKSAHTVTCSLQKDGSMRILLSSTSNATFYESESKRHLPVFTIKCKVSDNMPLGEYEMEMRGIVLNNYNLETGVTTAFEPEAVKAVVTVSIDTDIEGVNAANADLVDVYTVSGILIRSKVSAAKALTGLPKGIYVVGGETKVVK